MHLKSQRINWKEKKKMIKGMVLMGASWCLKEKKTITKISLQKFYFVWHTKRFILKCHTHPFRHLSLLSNLIICLVFLTSPNNLNWIFRESRYVEEKTMSGLFQLLIKTAVLLIRLVYFAWKLIKCCWYLGITHKARYFYLFIFS